jgi:hypothetical protein
MGPKNNKRRSSSGMMSHPDIARRTALQAGAVGMLGLGSNHLQGLLGAEPVDGAPRKTAKSVIYIFLSGGLAQHESFDLKPDAPEEIRGSFKPTSTVVPGMQICEHLPGLAKRADKWSVVRSMTHPTNGHTEGHLYMLTGRSQKPAGFRGDRTPRPSDWPSISSIVGDALPRRNNNLPPAIVLPERLVHWSGGVMPGAYGGLMGSSRDPFFIEASPYGDPMWRGAYPEYTYPNLGKKPPQEADARVYQAPNLKLPHGLTNSRLGDRLGLLNVIDRQRRALENAATVQSYDSQRQRVVSMLTDPKIRHAVDVTNADAKIQERYGSNSFGWSLLMAYRLVEQGVNLIQVNLGNNETWDTHGDAWPRLKDKLFPPTDRALCALIDDLDSNGLLDETLIVMAGEFGRTPKVSTLSDSFVGPGRDHWGAIQSVFFAGGGIQGGRVIGASDRIGGYPAADPHTPEEMAATIYHALGIPKTAAWVDESDRPHHIYHGNPIAGLL